ncbi:PAK4-inhibitor INKA2 [Stigmatopora argus]
MSKKKSMDVCLRRLKQELVSMKEAGDGLHDQMNSMMGALQELKLLQVQTALDNLNLSTRHPHGTTASDTSASEAEPRFRSADDLGPSPEPSTDFSQSRTSEGTLSSSGSSREMDASEGEDLESVPQRWSGYVAPQADFYGPTVGNPPPEPYTEPSTPNRPVDLPGILHSLSREGPSLDTDYSQDSTDDASDWTSSLMNQSRNRQPLVLGDNIFADLVGNWLDLPAIESEEQLAEGVKDEGADRPDSPAHPLRLSRSQEICRKFSLTTNIFKKFLRGVRPDRDRLLKERPGWMAPEFPEGNLVKRPKKAVPKSTKGSFYLPFWANGQQGKAQPETQPSSQTHIQQYQEKPFTGIYLDRRPPEGRLRNRQPLFDYNTAVWV